MDSYSIISIVSFIIVILFMLISVFLFSVKTDKKLSNILLAAFLIVTAIDISAFFYHNFIEIPLSLEMLRVQISNFKDPFLFLYILSVIYSDFKLELKHLILAIPWAICIIILMPNFFLVSIDEQDIFFKNYSDSNNLESQVISIITRVIEVAYIVGEIYYVLRYRKLLLENYTGKEAFYNYKWLKQLIIFILVGQLLTFIKALVRDSENAELNIVNTFRIFLLLFGLFFCFWLVLKAMLSPKLFRGVGVNLKLSKELDISTNDSRLSEQIQSLKSYMIDEEPFLDPSLTVQSLSEQINLPSRELSILINQELKQHFFDFVNGYRIEKAMKILKNPTQKSSTVLEILYEVGFNSKSSFNTAFKKHTGKTPTAFRKAP